MAFENDVKAYESAVTKIVKQKKYDDGIEELSILINRCEKDKGYSPTMLASYYRARGHGFLASNNYPKSILDYKKAIALLERAGDEGRANLNDTWYQLSLAYYYSKKPAETMEAANKCVETAENYFGSNHSNTIDAYSLRSNFEGFYNKGEDALRDRKKIFEIIQNNVERNFTYLTATERTAYWEKYLPETTVMFAFAQKLNEQQSEFTDALFDQQLLSKGLLLTAESALQRAIDGNPELSSAYQRIRNLRKKASDSKTNPKEAETATLEADRIERDLGTTANSLHQFMDFLKVHSGDVKNKLSTDDVAIEFVDYRIGKDSTMYAALVITPKLNHVRFIPLIEKKEVENNKDNLADYLWKPILNVLGYIPKNIYFAPSGLLYQIPIESQKLSDGRYMCDSFNMYRMSSTRWLSYKNNDFHGNGAIVYGGLDYDTTIDDINKDMEKYPSVAHNKKRGTTSLRGGLSGLEYLPSTKTEAEEIFKLFSQSGIATKCYMGKEGTEASLLSISGKKIKYIHIASHGLVFENGKDPLESCCICLAGANNIIEGEKSLQANEDGILTAKEISEMNLSGLDLFVMSACQTGLGRISYDGVWGLQRGVKKAGGNSIIMTLWDVDDEIASNFMGTFYQELLQGKGKLQSFENAKKSIRNISGDDNYDSWASFILLDGKE